MLAMVGLLALIVIAIRIAAKPSAWYWLTGRPADSASGGAPAADVSNRDIDFRVRVPDDSSLPPGVFRSVKHAPTMVGGEHPAAGTDAANQEPQDHSNQAPNHETAIDEAILAPIKDNTLGVRRAEKAAHDFILAKARDVPLKELERAARDDVVFAVLMIDSDRFRGKLLTITGELKRLVMLPAAKNDFGLNDLYEAWIANADSGDNLYRVVCTEIPADIPADILADILTGELIEESVPVRTTGYFFKRFGYATVESRLHVAPLILARSLQQISAPPAVTDHHELTGYILTVVAAVVVAVAIMVWCYSVSDKKFQQTQLKRLTNAPSEAIGALTSVETTDVNDLFRTMTEEARAADQTETSRNVTPSRNHDDAAKPQIE